MKPDLPPVKAQKSGGNGGNCLEMSRRNGMIELHDTKDGGAGPVLRFTLTELDAFLDGVKNGEFDHLIV